jgi:Fe-S-cluster-containing dehydrogenase component
MYFLPMHCQQCTNAPCVAVCPTGASYRDEDNGVVMVDEETCIACKSCLTACPYSDPEGQSRPSVRWLRPDTNHVTKCTLCNHLTAKSDGIENIDDSFDEAHAVPPCVHNCCNGARFFGDLDNDASTVSQAVAQAESDGRGVYQVEAEGVEPTSLYILSESICEWHGMGDGYVLYAKG